MRRLIAGSLFSVVAAMASSAHGASPGIVEPPRIMLVQAERPACCTEVQGSLRLGSKVVPLPPGPWRVLHQGQVQGRTSELTTPTTTHQAVLVQEHAGRAAALVIAEAAQEVGVVWHPFGVCLNQSAFARRIEAATRGRLDCRGMVMVGSGLGPGTPAYLHAFYAEGTTRPGWIPPRWLSSQFVLSEGMHMLRVEYRYAPTVFAPAAANAPNWNDGARNPAAEAVVTRLTAWGDGVQATLRRALYGAAPAAPLPAPF